MILVGANPGEQLNRRTPSSLVLSLSPFDVSQGDPEALEGSKDELRRSWFDKLTMSGFCYAISLIAFGCEAVVCADGGLLRARQKAGPFTVSIFTAPEPLRVGAVDVSVLVQSSGGSVVTDADVDVLFESATRPVQQRRATATHDAASNKLASAAVVGLPAAGQWMLTVSVRSNGNAATVTCLLPVAPARSRMSVIWPWLLLPPLGIALFGVHQTLKRHRSSVRSARGSVFASRT